jgi:hypothetical protein
MQNNGIDFLDVHIMIDKDGKCQRSIYRKPTNTGRYLNFDSYHHPSHNISVIDALVYRALIICDDKFIQDELKTITNTLISNGYPKNLIERRIDKMKTKLNNPIRQITEKIPRFILPYIGPTTNRLTSFLKRNLNCAFGFIPGRKIKKRSLFPQRKIKT